MEASWGDTEVIVKEVIQDKLNLSQDFEIEWCHRVARKNPGKRNLAS